MTSYLTYILYSPNHDIFYIGHTNDLEYRMSMHNEFNPNSYTSRYRPWEVFATLQFQTRSSAMKAENYLKKKHRDFLKRIPNDPELQDYIFNKFEG